MILRKLGGELGAIALRTLSDSDHSSSGIYPKRRLVKPAPSRFDSQARTCLIRRSGRAGTGFWLPIILGAVERFLDCGDLKKGFARVRCPKCRHELFVVFFVPRPARLPGLPPEAGAGEVRLGG